MTCWQHPVTRVHAPGCSKTFSSCSFLSSHQQKLSRPHLQQSRIRHKQARRYEPLGCCSSSDHLQTSSRRQALRAAALLLGTAASWQVSGSAQAIRGRRPPEGFRLFIDKLDGYSFFYPDTWTPVSSSGNEVFLRNPYNVNENLYVTISSPSSSKYQQSDLQSPDATAQVILKQFLTEYMSTRLGVRREADIVDAELLTGDDSKQYSQIQIQAKSYASRQQLAVSQQARDQGMELEWDRRFISILGVANKRLYQLRLQTADQTYQRNKAVLDQIAQSFQCSEVV